MHTETTIMSGDDAMAMEMRVMSVGCTDKDFRTLMDSHEEMRKRLANLDDKALYEVARYEVEKVLVEWRESRLSVMGRGNGLVIHEADGTESSTIRLSIEQALKIGMRAYIQDQFGIEPAPDNV